MPIVASVRLRYVPKNYWFDPAGVDVNEGDHVLVETKRGKELGLCVAAGLEVDDKDVKAPLKPILRVATEEDYDRVDELAAKGGEALRRFRELAAEHGLDMKPVEVEYMLDGNHATFYFTADDRVDFRSLVRDLASEFHVRVDMRQIGVRDEARALGGLGHCGQELCCARMGGEFAPVSIRMAKDQDLPLNPAKISGLCGRLMCCLRYEFEAYKDFKSRSPKKNAMIDTPLGLAKVVDFDTPRESVRVRFEDGKSMDIPVSLMDTGDKVAREGENLRPCHVSAEAFDRIIEELHQDDKFAMMGDKLFSDAPELADATARAGSVERTPRRRRKRGGAEQEGASGERRRRGSRGHGAASEPKPRDERRRRRSVSVADGGETPGDKTARDGGSEPARKRRRRGSRGGKGRSGSAQQERVEQQGAGKPRPGQHSSTVSGDSGQGGSGEGGAPRKRRRRGRRGGRGRNRGGSGGGKPEAGA